MITLYQPAMLESLLYRLRMTPSAQNDGLIVDTETYLRWAVCLVTFVDLNGQMRRAPLHLLQPGRTSPRLPGSGDIAVVKACAEASRSHSLISCVVAAVRVSATGDVIDRSASCH